MMRYLTFLEVKCYQDDEILNFYINLYIYDSVFLLAMICFNYFFSMKNPFEVECFQDEEISIDFSFRLPCTSKNNESILVVVDGCAESICD
jgi:hypothetical protein